jgi:4-amino-4-deoxy-L-arabinose transferase-like glycosyltransferase
MKSIASDDPIESWRRGLGGVLDYVCASHGRAVVALILLSLLAFLPGLGRIPPIDRDEAYTAQASKQMWTSGDVVAVQFQNETRDKQPAGIHWLQVLSLDISAMTGRRDVATRIVHYRFPSLIGAIGAVLLTYWTALSFLRRRAAVVAAVALAACVLLGLEARLAKPDAAFLVTVVAAMGVLARLYLNRPEGGPDWYRGIVLPLVFWGALAGGVLLKGMTIFMVVGLPLVVLCSVERQARWLSGLQPMIGVPFFLLLVLPWLIAILGRAGLVFLVKAAAYDLYTKVFTSQDGNGAPPGFYLVQFFLTFWPAALLAGLAVPGIWRARHDAPIRFLIAWIVPTWILLELVITKRPHFVLPLYPACAILIAGCIDMQRLSKTRWMEYGTFWWFAVPVGFAVGALVLLLRVEGDLGWRAWPFFAAAVIFGFRAWWLYEIDGVERSLLRASAASMLLAIAVYWTALPMLTALFPSAMVARTVHAAECAKPAVSAAGFHEPSLVLLLGTDTQLTDGAGAADFLTRGPCRFAVIEQSYQRQFVRRAESIGLRYDKSAAFSGINLGTFSRLNFTIYRSKDNH